MNSASNPSGQVVNPRSASPFQTSGRYNCDVIVFEDLTNIREDTRGAWGHIWAFRTLFEQVEHPVGRDDCWLRRTYRNPIFLADLKSAFACELDR